VLLLSIGSWLLYRTDARVKLFALLSLLFVVLQGVLGALTVMFEGTFALNWILAIHFGLSLIAFASVILLTIRLFQVGRGQQARREIIRSAVSRLQFTVWGLVVYTYIVVYTGALVEHTGAVIGCGSSLPGCGSTYFPSFASLAGIQVLHRYAAGLLWLLVLCLLVIVLRSYRERHDLVLGAWWAFTLITLQAVSGLFNVWTAGQMLATLVHTTLISVFFSVLCFFCVQVGWPWKRKKLAQYVENKHLEVRIIH